MTEYLGKLMFSPITRMLIYTTSVCRDIYVCNMHYDQAPISVEHYDKQSIKHAIDNGSIVIINAGDKVYFPDGRQFRIERIFSQDMQLFGTTEELWITYQDFYSFGLRFECENKFPEKITNNKGRTTCFSCKCPTEMKRDFSDFSVREFCPRCKI